MPTEEPIVDAKGQKESPRARRAFDDYLRMAPGKTQSRSLRNLLAAYKTNPLAPTKSWATLTGWSHRYHWVARAAEWDRAEAARIADEYQRRRRAIMETGLAQVHERVDKLNTMFDRLFEDFSAADTLWLHEPKGIGSGENFREVEVIRFNASLVGELRALLDDIASEVGGRPRKTELTGKNGGPIRSTSTPLDLSKLSIDDLEQLEQIVEKASDDNDAEPGRSTG
jgi:hypothetical protein